MNPVVSAVLIRECIRIIRVKAPDIIREIIEARHPKSDGGRMLTSQERQNIIRVVLKRVSDEE